MRRQRTQMLQFPQLAPVVSKVVQTPSPMTDNQIQAHLDECSGCSMTAELIEIHQMYVEGPDGRWVRAELDFDHGRIMGLG